MRLSGTISIERYAPLASGAARWRTPGSKFAGGHRIRVTPVPIPNTEVKPDTADGTVWETVWESRSLPAVLQTRPPGVGTRRAFLFVRPRRSSRPAANGDSSSLTHNGPLPCHPHLPRGLFTL